MPQALEKCPSCRSETAKIYSHVEQFDAAYADYGVAQTNCMLKDVFQVERIERELRQCRRCGLAFVSPTFTSEELDRLYRTAKMSDHYKKVKSNRPSPSEHIADPRRIWEKESRHSRFVFDRVREVVSDLKGRTVVDIGGQYGYHCRDFLQEGSSCYVQDWVQAPVLYPGVRYIDKLAAVDKIDVGICTHVLEHLTDVRSFLNEIALRQEPGSVFYVEVPYEIDSRLRNRNFGVPHHICFFSTEALSNVLAEAGYRPRRVALRRRRAAPRDLRRFLARSVRRKETLGPAAGP
jgi:hypothetical protein